MHMLLLNINRKAYMGRPMTLTFDLELPCSSISRSLGFQKLISRKEAEIGHMLQLNINRKP